jgi:hypothetical protein
MDQVVRRRYNKKMYSSNTNYSFNTTPIGQQVVSPSRRRRPTARRSLELGNERGYSLRHKVDEDDDDEDDEYYEEDDDLEDRSRYTSVSWNNSSVATTAPVNKSTSRLVSLAQAITAFSLLGMIFMVRGVIGILILYSDVSYILY